LTGLIEAISDKDPWMHNPRMKLPRAGTAILLCLQLAAIAPLGAQQAAPPPQAPVVETGEIDGARFRIEIPAGWNKGLVMYTHGYVVAGSPPQNFDNPQFKWIRGVFLSRGFAFAESGYHAQGWAVKEAIEDTEALRRYFVKKYGAPSETYVTGHSMGGHITVAIIERYADVYQGALPMCGPLGAAIDFFNTGVFDMLVTFEALFPGSIGSPYEASAATVGRVTAAIAADPQKAARYAQRFSRDVGVLPGVLGFFQSIMAELKQRAGGEPFDNRNRIYVGFGDDVALNRTVKRYAADPAAREYVRQYSTPTGRISDPVLTLHTTADPLVLGSDVTEYETIATIAGTQDLFVARYVSANGHCAFTPQQTGAAFDALLAWARDKKKPEGGEQK
jgi:alpha-beta hydrolase superfamily lysophospholipase